MFYRGRIMTKKFILPPNASMGSQMKRTGYTYHCDKDGRPCYHRQLSDLSFPRFHAYVVNANGQIEIDLHFDAHNNIYHQSNHNQSWAYSGGRIEDEMRRISEILNGQKVLQVSGMERLQKNEKQERTSKNFFDLLFR
jgi:hypothetical protein